MDFIFGGVLLILLGFSKEGKNKSYLVRRSLFIAGIAGIFIGIAKIFAGI